MTKIELPEAFRAYAPITSYLIDKGLVFDARNKHKEPLQKLEYHTMTDKEKEKENPITGLPMPVFALQSIPLLITHVPLSKKDDEEELTQAYYKIGKKLDRMFLDGNSHANPIAEIYGVRQLAKILQVSDHVKGTQFCLCKEALQDMNFYGPYAAIIYDNPKHDPQTKLKSYAGTDIIHSPFIKPDEVIFFQATTDVVRMIVGKEPTTEVLPAPHQAASGAVDFVPAEAKVQPRAWTMMIPQFLSNHKNERGIVRS